MNKFSTKIRQKQSIIPKQILQSSFLELGLDDIEKELENEIQKNPNPYPESFSFKFKKPFAQKKALNLKFSFGGLNI